MNGTGGSQASRPRAGLRRAAMMAAAAAVIALLASACGGGRAPASSTGPPTLRTITDQALAYARCMRSHGIANFPDPTVQDTARSKGVGFSLTGIDSHTPPFRSAAKVCQRQTGFGHVSAVQLQAAMAPC